MFASQIADQILQVNNQGKTEAIKDDNGKALLDLLKGLSNGETILGKVLSSSDSSYVFKALESGVTVNAKAQNGVYLEPGSTVLFEVNKYSESHVNLRPLNLNTSTSETAKTAIKLAGLPLNEKTLEMTFRNMEYGNPIDRHSLYESYKDVIKFPDAPVKYIVDLQTMDIPRTEENISQYEAYVNMKNALSEDVFSLVKGLSEDFKIQDAQLSDESINLSKDIETVEQAIGKLESFSNTISEKDIFPELSDNLKNVVAELRGKLDEALKLPEREQFKLTIADNKTDTLSKLTEALGRASETSYKTQPQAVRTLIQTLNSAVEESFSQNLLQKYVLDTDKVIHKEEITKLYERLFSDTKKLTETLEEVAPKGTNVASLAHSINSNIDFMNSLNNFVPYLQIPFRSDSSSKTGELYVFRNKSSRVSEEGELTAFLHLDTDNLGPCDIYVKKKEDRISTNFTLKDEASLDFIEKNIHYLDERLKKKGYSFSFSGSIEKDVKSPIQQAIDNCVTKVYFANTSFDARV